MMCCMHEHNIVFIIYSHCKNPDKTQDYNNNAANFFHGINFFCYSSWSYKISEDCQPQVPCDIHIVTENFLGLLGFDLSHQTQ